eukprot:13148185-Alexandrium_andersonii.AAC.1
MATGLAILSGQPMALLQAWDARLCAAAAALERAVASSRPGAVPRAATGLEQAVLDAPREAAASVGVTA